MRTKTIAFLFVLLIVLLPILTACGQKEETSSLVTTKISTAITQSTPSKSESPTTIDRNKEEAAQTTKTPSSKRVTTQRKTTRISHKPTTITVNNNIDQGCCNHRNIIDLITDKN